jgi:hypothetical protein
MQYEQQQTSLDRAFTKTAKEKHKMADQIVSYFNNSPQYRKAGAGRILASPEHSLRRTQKMPVTLPTNAKIVTGEARSLVDPVAVSVAKNRKHRLVARWLTDENSQRYCQWVIED